VGKESECEKDVADRYITVSSYAGAKGAPNYVSFWRLCTALGAWEFVHDGKGLVTPPPSVCGTTYQHLTSKHALFKIKPALILVQN